MSKTLYPKKEYTLYIKSHVDGFSDYEDTCEATSKLEATRIFLKRINKPFVTEEGFESGDWDEKTIYENVIAEDEFGGGLHG